MRSLTAGGLVRRRAGNNRNGVKIGFVNKHLLLSVDFFFFFMYILFYFTHDFIWTLKLPPPAVNFPMFIFHTCSASYFILDWMQWI